MRSTAARKSHSSQVMMEKLVMQGKPMMEVPTTMVPGAMAALIEAVKNYDNSANAIGYTVYYYAADMQMASGLKILSVDEEGNVFVGETAKERMSLYPDSVAARGWSILGQRKNLRDLLFRHKF